MRKIIKSLLHSKWMPLGAALLGFLEASFVLFPLEPLVIPLLVAQRLRAYLTAVYLVIGNILGALLIYALGAFAAATIVEPTLAALSMLDEYREAALAIEEDGFRTLFVIGVTPIPYQLGAAGAGAVAYPLAAFILAVSLSRGLRYSVLAGFAVLLGARVGDFIAKHETTIMLLGVLLFIVGVLLTVL